MNQIQDTPRDEAARRTIRGARSIELPISRDQDICLDRTILVRASAGSGKTSVLIDRMVALVRSGVPLGSIVAITFTRKASGELQERFFAGLIKARTSVYEIIQSGNESTASLWKSEYDLLNKAVEEIEESYIGTIHAFCTQLLRYGALDLGIPPEFELINEQDEEALRLRFWNSYLQEASTSENSDLEVLHDADVPFEWLFDLFGTLSKNEAVDFELSHRPCPDPSSAFDFLKDFVVRVASLVPQMNDPDNFSTEMERMKALISTLETSNKYVQIRLLKSALGLVKGGKTPELNIVLGRWGSAKSEPKMLAENIKKGREELGLEHTFDHFLEAYVAPLVQEWNHWLHDRALGFTRSAVDAYLAHRLASGKLTYDDLLSQSLRLLRQFPALRATFQGRFTHILVDEFQDTDPTQAAMLFCLASKDWNDSDWSKSALLPGRLFLVGDDKQSIYRFRKADFQAFHLVRKAIADQNGLDLKLSTNFRSDSRLCSWINATLGPRFQHSGVPFQAPWEDLEPFWGDLGLDPVLHFQIAKKSKGVVLAHQTMGEAEAIVNHILQLTSASEHDLDFGNFMILVRRHANIPEYVAALTAAGIPVGVAGGKADQITDLLAHLDDLFSAVYNPFNGPALAATLRGPFYGVSDQDLYDFVQQGGALHELLG
ncbi:UvrD-helicase domain-containing protein, partial [bacterium]|nr:UvrD-helicase domain-containing protein [bacterium]